MYLYVLILAAALAPLAVAVTTHPIIFCHHSLLFVKYILIVNRWKSVGYRFMLTDCCLYETQCLSLRFSWCMLYIDLGCPNGAAAAVGGLHVLVRFYALPQKLPLPLMMWLLLLTWVGPRNRTTLHT